MIGPNVTMGLPQHSTKLLSSNIIFSASDSEHFLNFCNYKEGNEENILRINKYLNNNENKKMIEIGNDVWIGYGATIMRGVSIGDGAVIGAGSVVTKNVLPYTIVGGVPAKFIRNRFSIEQTAELLKIRWWDYGPDILKGIDISDIDAAIRLLKERTSIISETYECYKIKINGMDNSITIEL